MAERESTGLKGLDEVLNHLRKGDNVVWQVDSVNDFLHFVRPFVSQSQAGWSSVSVFEICRSRTSR